MFLSTSTKNHTHTHTTTIRGAKTRLLSSGEKLEDLCDRDSINRNSINGTFAVFYCAVTQLKNINGIVVSSVQHIHNFILRGQHCPNLTLRRNLRLGGGNRRRLSGYGNYGYGNYIFHDRSAFAFFACDYQPWKVGSTYPCWI